MVGSLRNPSVVNEPLGSWFQPLFPLDINAVSRLTRPVVGNEEMAAFASWLIYPDVFNTSPDFQNTICHRITKLKRLSFILICFSYYLAFFSLSLSFLISRQEAWRLQRMWSSGWLNSLSSEPHTLMSGFFFLFRQNQEGKKEKHMEDFCMALGKSTHE